MIFLDVGAHEGQTLEVALRYGFDRIYAFEPMPDQYAALVRRFGRLADVSLCNYGLTDRTASLRVYGTNEEMEASIYAAKADVDSDVVTECEFVEASEFFADHVSGGAVVKLNCEGSEIPILDNLLDTGEIWKVANVMIDFDVRKIPGQEQHEDLLLERFRSVGFGRYSLREDVMLGETHAERIGCWLDLVDA